jgi:thioredoxin 1
MSDATKPNAPGKPIHAESRAEVDRIIAEHDRVLLDVYSSGCAICQSIEPVLGNVAKVTDATVVLFNPKHDLSSVEEWNVRSVPTLLLFEEGEQVDRMSEGFQGAERIVSFVDGDA